MILKDNESSQKRMAGKQKVTELWKQIMSVFSVVLHSVKSLAFFAFIPGEVFIGKHFESSIVYVMFFMLFGTS